MPHSAATCPTGCHDRAVLLYEYVGKRTVDLQHTEVPDAYRGRGIAKHLAKVGGGVTTPPQAEPHPRADPGLFLGSVQRVPTLPAGCSEDELLSEPCASRHFSPAGGGGSGPRPRVLWSEPPGPQSPPVGQELTGQVPAQMTGA